MLEAFYNLQSRHIFMDKGEVQKAFERVTFFVCHPDLPRARFSLFQSWLRGMNPELPRNYHALDNTLDWDADHHASKGKSEYWRLKSAALPIGKTWKWSNWTTKDGVAVPTYQFDFETAVAMYRFHKAYTLQDGMYQGVYRDMSLQDWWPPHLWQKAKDAGWSDSEIWAAIAKTAIGRRAFIQIMRDEADISVNTRIPFLDPDVNFITLEGAGERFGFDEIVPQIWEWKEFTNRDPFHVVLWDTDRSNSKLIDEVQRLYPETVLLGRGPWGDDAALFE